MVFRRDNRGGDAFQRQISALRQQLGGTDPQDEAYEDEDVERAETTGYGPSTYEDTEYEPEERRYRPGDYERSYEPEQGLATVEDDEPALPSIPRADTQMTVVSHNTIWKGEIESEGSMHIHGRFEGVIRAQEDVFVLEEANVSANIAARNVVIGGRYDGEVRCESRFEVLPTGNVQGSVRAPILVVHDGAEINGSIQMTVSESSRPEPAQLVQRREQRESSGS
jgi:cytoskeletal protein CcmA (bactofilin family)